MLKLDFIGKAITIVWLLWMAVWDLKEKRIPGYCIAMGIIPAIVSIYSYWPRHLLPAILGFFLGFCFLLLSMATKEQIGKADGMILILLGTMAGLYRLIEILCFCFVYLFIVAAALLFLRKKTRKQTLPFIPFLMAGYVSTLL